MHTAFYEKKEAIGSTSSQVVTLFDMLSLFKSFHDLLLESISYLSLTISINHKTMFDGLWGRWGARKGAALLVGR